MRRIALTFAAAVLSTAAVQAKDLCITPDPPVFGFYTIDDLVLKNLKLGPRQFGPVYGVLTESHSFAFPGGSSTFWFGVDGQAVTSSRGELAVGLQSYSVGLEIDGPIGSPPVGPYAFQAGAGPVGAVTLTCQPGPKGVVDATSTCTLVTPAGGSQTAKVTACSGMVLP